MFAGDREIGVYVAFDDSVSDTPLTLEHLGLDGTTPLITAYASDSNIWNPADCCAEDHADKRIPITVVALGPTGMLLSLGAFDSTRAQVEVAWDNSKLFPTHHFATSYSSGSRFYVNGPPSWIPCGWTGLDGTCHDPQPATTGMWPRPGI